MKKVCSKCGEEKELELFAKDNRREDGCSSHCKGCRLKYYYDKREYYLEKQRKYSEKNKEKVNHKRREKYAKLSKEEKKILIKKNNEWRRKNKDYLNEYSKKYYKKNKKRIHSIRNKSVKKRMKKDAKFRFLIAIRSSIRSSIYRMNYTKKSRTYKILGCSYEEFKQHLESQFQDGMTWDNYGRGGWHIDHIYPLSKARDEEHLLELNHYTNLQPLWEKDNIAKGNRLDWSE